MTHREAVGAWGRSMGDLVPLVLLIAGVSPFIGLPGSTNFSEAAKADPRWLVLLVAVLGISYRAAYKTIRTDRGRCADDALASNHDLRVAVACMDCEGSLERAGAYRSET